MKYVQNVNEIMSSRMSDVYLLMIMDDWEMKGNENELHMNVNEVGQVELSNLMYLSKVLLEYWSNHEKQLLLVLKLFEMTSC
jgi:hypothetical protein